MDPLLLLGVIILVGFVGRLIFGYTRIPESLFMILIGLAIGPLLHIVDPTIFEGYSSLIAMITLILVLLDTGLNLDILDTTKCFGIAFIFTILVLVFSTILVGALFAFVLGWELPYALLMGIMSSGSTIIVCASLLPRLKVPVNIQQILLLESVINDVTIITGALVLLQVIELGTLDLSELVMALVAPITLAVVVGLISALLWVQTLWKFYRGTDLAYVFTVGLLFILFPFVEFIGGNGAIAVFVLSISLGNLPFLLEQLFEGGSIDTHVIEHLRERFREVDRRIKESGAAFTFFIQNFFFVYLGVVFDVAQVNYLLIGTCGAILALVFTSRYVSARVLSIFRPEVRPHATIMASILARGFTTTFVALLPSTKGINVPLFKEIALTLVLFSTIITLIGSIIYELKSPRIQV